MLNEAGRRKFEQLFRRPLTDEQAMLVLAGLAERLDTDTIIAAAVLAAQTRGDAKAAQAFRAAAVRIENFSARE